MTQASRPTRLLRPTLLLGGLFAFGLASLAHGAPVDGGVQWYFLGTASVSVSDPTCCQPLISDGQQVFGSLTITSERPPPFPSELLSNVFLDIYSLDGAPLLIGTFGSWGLSEVGKQDGQPAVPGGAAATPDVLSFAHNYVNQDPIVNELRLQPPWQLFPDPYAYFSLIDQDGVAWSGLNPRTGDIFPDTPPDASLFETRQLALNLRVARFDLGLYGSVPTTIQIDQFLPEPGVTALLAATFFALVALTPGAARRP